MPQLIKLQTSDATSNYTPQSGFCTMFVATTTAGTAIKVKKSDGSIAVVGGGGTGYTRKVVSVSGTLNNGDWALVDTDCTVTLPGAVAGAYVAVSTIGQADNVIVAPASGDTIQSDSQGVTIDAKKAKMEFFGTAGKWLIAEAK